MPELFILQFRLFLIIEKVSSNLLKSYTIRGIIKKINTLYIIVYFIFATKGRKVNEMSVLQL